MLQVLLQRLRSPTALQSLRCFASDTGSASKSVVRKESKAQGQVAHQNYNEDSRTISVTPGQAFPGDNRSSSGLGLGDGLTSHTAKWLQDDGHFDGNLKSPMEYIHDAPPIKVHGAVVASFGSEDPALGAPVEYIDLRGTTYESPAVCKYTGNKYYSDDWGPPFAPGHSSEAHH
ncbi:hypothetical protein CVIRNUC_001317 [Coccomyxa viridis]|uniref:Uncharacterized protein n=1 Tax=Coccomyxa viridis TaxID=1274662 RepID=A0AAV1HTC3_9CHLO|nr:hypothetical protein CVIRNUC_001317 [Coccomyxa viridis]